LSTGIIFDVKKFSIHDGPGIRTTIFFKGCPLACWWCHNPESQSMARELAFTARRCIGCGACVAVCPRGAIVREGDTILTRAGDCDRCGACVDVCYAEAREMVGRRVDVAELVLEIEKDIPFYEQSGGGVTFSGGEPLAQPDFLLDLLRACQERGIHTAVDTCGFAPWEVLERVRGEVDLFLYDLKLMDDAAHRTYTGVSNASIRANLERLSALSEAIVIRVPIIPGINDGEPHVQQMAAFVAGLPHVERVDLLPYHHIAADKYRRLGMTYRLPDVPPPTDARMHAIGQIFESSGLSVKIGG